MNPAQIIAQFKTERRALSDSALLRELERLPVLPPEDSDDWQAESQWHTAYRFVALADLAAERHLRLAIPLLLERSCCGDPGEMMRGLRHSLEAIVAPDYDALTPYCIAAAASLQAGARMWAIDELGVLRHRSALPTLLGALSDSVTEVRRAACLSLSMFAPAHRDLAAQIIAALTGFRDSAIDTSERKDADDAIQSIITA